MQLYMAQMDSAQMDAFGAQLITTLPLTSPYSLDFTLCGKAAFTPTHYETEYATKDIFVFS